MRQHFKYLIISRAAPGKEDLFLRCGICEAERRFKALTGPGFTATTRTASGPSAILLRLAERRIGGGGPANRPSSQRLFAGSYNILDLFKMAFWANEY